MSVEAMKLAQSALKLIFASTLPYTDAGDPTLTDKASTAGTQALAALESALAAQGEAGAGWKLVPVEPTPEMVAAYLEAQAEYWRRTDELPTPPDKWRTGTPTAATASGYRAMLAAAPAAEHPATIKKNLIVGQAAEPSPTSDMNIAQRILHVGGRNNAAGYVEFGSIQAVEALVRQVLRDLPQPTAAHDLTDPTVQARLAAQWGYVKVEGEPVLCVSRKKFSRMRAADDHVRAWLPPTTYAEDMPLYTTPQPAPTLVPMTEREIIALRASCRPGKTEPWVDTIAFARAVEQHHADRLMGGV